MHTITNFEKSEATRQAKQQQHNTKKKKEKNDNVRNLKKQSSVKKYEDSANSRWDAIAKFQKAKWY